MQEDELKKALSNLIRKELKEMSTTGNVAGFESPFAFSDDEEEKKEKDELGAKALGFELLPESVDWKSEDMSHKKKIYESIRNVKNRLNEIETLINKTIKYKNENDISAESYWKNTKLKLNKVNEQLIRISNKIKGAI